MSDQSWQVEQRQDNPQRATDPGTFWLRQAAETTEHRSQADRDREALWQRVRQIRARRARMLDKRTIRQTERAWRREILYATLMRQPNTGKPSIGTKVPGQAESVGGENIRASKPWMQSRQIGSRRVYRRAEPKAQAKVVGNQAAVEQLRRFLSYQEATPYHEQD